MKCFGLFAPTQAPRWIAAQVERMLTERFGFDVHVLSVRRAGGAGNRRAGGKGRTRECATMPVCRRPHPAPDDEANGQDMSLFILEGESREPAELTAFGHHTRIWSRGGNTFVLITPAADNPVAAAARYVADQAR